MVSKFTISLVVRTYTEKRWHYLEKCLDSLLYQTRQPDQLIVVVDHNLPLMEKIRQTYPAVTAVENTLPQGSSGAWNSGVQNAASDMIAFVDDDALADEDWLEKLMNHYQNPEVYGVGGHIEPIWESGKPEWFPDEFLWVVGCSYTGLPEEVEPVRNMIGCNMSFRRETFNLIGGFREGMGHVGSSPIGCDETEICIRLQQQVPGIVLLHDPAAIVHHHVPAQRSTWRYFLRRCSLEGRSKAQVSYYVGSHSGLETERRYTAVILPRGVYRNLKKGFQGDRAGFGKAAAIVAGFFTTAINFSVHSIRLRLFRNTEKSVTTVIADKS